ncbi:hypothetical protein [Pseudomonas sp. OIL-1]|uniref:oxidoreductase n=1 Tax=Pseudomonas sp. OIL-1 TaxID=2706126 RepID=UPI0013A75F99|nr:hypothetical protein [Pseudomonas sp. OIL-1]QIB52411.1 hypothetical protein G3M63_15995 [Pseudomonas sp. OIL-1]
MPHFGSNRKLFFLPVNTGFSTNQTPDTRCIEFYRERSGGGLYCAIVGNVVLPDGTGTNSFCSVISDRAAWRILADTISGEGALAGIQLASCWSGYKGMQRFLATSIDQNLKAYRETAAAISEKDVVNAFDSLALGTTLAARAGFRHVQLHAAHGYLFNLAIDPRFTRHAGLAMEKLSEWAGQLAHLDIESSIRLSLATGSAELDDSIFPEFFDQIANVDISYIDLSSGFYNLNKRLIYPSTNDLLSQRIAATVEFAARHPKRKFIVSGKSLRGWNGALPENVQLGICRDLIANPHYLTDRSAGCINRMKCHYHSRGTDFLTCGQWAKT